MLTYDQTAPSLYGAQPTSTNLVPVMPATNGLRAQPHHRHIWIITGPAGCGKSTVGKHIADSLELPYIEGDEYHPKANIEKMGNGIPLTDADRWDWLILLREQSVRELETGASGVVVTCSALKKKYRDVIRVASYNNVKVVVHFVYLQATEEMLMARVRARPGHYMKDNMVRSQFESLEEPDHDELSKDVLAVDVSGTMPQVQALALGLVQEVLKQDSLPTAA
ncbi:shikimate kinase [Diplodia corticola]|uniref:Gluconokinase n=1 Tax=Diplodia corticola TaxID=236234 RepID=A0A1J9SAY6_9PEZI|nr:shikimate kinase [Diplodia corticola]OJD37655.1 shikimate kinase [Diplodia corticola]